MRQSVGDRITRSLLLACVLWFGSLSAVAQDQSALGSYVGEHAVPIRTIDPADEDFADLEPLIDLIGDARVVALGEQSHGDGTAFLAKHRLIRFLHQRMGFDVLAWESGMFDCREMDRALQDGAWGSEAAGIGIFPIWGESGHVLPVLDYAESTRGTDRRLEMAGFDCQFSSGNSLEAFPAFLTEFFGRIDSTRQTDERVAQLRKLIDDVWNRTTNPDDTAAVEALDSLMATLQEFKTDLENVHGTRETAFVAKVLQNAKTAYELAMRSDGDPFDINKRDGLMGENLVWLANTYYPERKIIVWGASFHLMRSARSIRPLDDPNKYANTTPMGQVVHDALGDDYYSVMFVAHEGRAGNPFFDPFDIDTSMDGSLEFEISRTGKPYVLVPLDDGFGAAAPTTLARPLGYSPMEAPWHEAFDAAFYTGTMFPSTRDGALPPGIRTTEVDEDTAQIQAALESLRVTTISYGLVRDELFPGPMPGYDAGRLVHFAGDQSWPKWISTNVHVDADRYRLVDQHDGNERRSGGGALVFPDRLDTDWTTPTTSTMLLFKGLGPEVSLVAKSYSTLISLGAVDGDLHFESYAVVTVDGALSGSFRADSYIGLLVEGPCSARLSFDSYCLVYLRGGFTGSLSFRDDLSPRKTEGCKVFVAGRTTARELEKFTGRGVVYLEDSDLPRGEHTVRGLTVRVGALRGPD